jgi:hypothetical protein
MGRVLRIGALVATAAAPLAAILVSSAVLAPHRSGAGGGSQPTLAVGPGPVCLPDDKVCQSCPVIIDVDGSGYHLTSAADGVLFDFAGRGQLVRIAWTAPGSTNAFLVLPHNGRVDNGSELFGNLTPQPRSAHRNGFNALAVWDQPRHGGDGDGVIGPGDAVWSRLRLWQDTNHDGTVEPGELRPLSAFGITGISVRYRAVGGADRYGNRYGYAAAVYSSGRAAPVAYDFFFTIAPAGPASPPGNGWLNAAEASAAGAVVLAGAALTVRRRRRARRRAQIPVTVGQAERDPDVPVSIGR